MAKKPAVTNTEDRQQISEAERIEREQKTQRERDILWLMKDNRGRRFIHDLLIEKCGVLHSSYGINVTGRGSDPTFKEGERNVGLTLLAELNDTCPREWLLAQAEALELKLDEEFTDG